MRLWEGARDLPTSEQWRLFAKIQSTLEALPTTDEDLAAIFLERFLQSTDSRRVRWGASAFSVFNVKPSAPIAAWIESAVTRRTDSYTQREITCLIQDADWRDVPIRETVERVARNPAAQETIVSWIARAPALLARTKESGDDTASRWDWWEYDDDWRELLHDLASSRNDESALCAITSIWFLDDGCRQLDRLVPMLERIVAAEPGGIVHAHVLDFLLDVKCASAPSIQRVLAKARDDPEMAWVFDTHLEEQTEIGAD